MTGCEMCQAKEARLRRSPWGEWVLCRACWADVQEARAAIRGDQ